MLKRRHFIAGASALAFQAGGRVLFPDIAAASQTVSKADLTLRIAPVSVELAPGKIVKTIGYNGKVPGPILRMREGVATTVDVLNDTDAEELVHWHVFKGEVVVQQANNGIVATSGYCVTLKSSSELTGSKFNKKQFERSDLYRFSSMRSTYLAEVDASHWESYYWPGWRGSGRRGGGRWF